MFKKLLFLIILQHSWGKPLQQCSLSSSLRSEIAAYSSVVNQIFEKAINGPFKGVTYNELAKFVDKFGSRQSGTNNLENAIDYMMEMFKKHNLENVHGENVQVPYWPRGEESAQLLEPRKAKIGILGLGSSVSTPTDGLTAEAIVVKNFDELERKANLINGKIVVFNNEFDVYYKTMKYRDKGASRAARHGAVAALIRSVTNMSLYTLHTGWQDYDANVTKIPVASITVEDAEMLQRMQDRGDTLKIYLKMLEGDIIIHKSRNTIAEIKGKTKPDKVVIISGHIDSWDVGKGAMDDGGGVFITWAALALLKSLDLRPARTIRGILWTGEEEGLYGAKAYLKEHMNEKNNFDVIMESDNGTFNPLGLDYFLQGDGACILYEVLQLLAPRGTNNLRETSDLGTDVDVFIKEKIPTLSLMNENQDHYLYHHTNADTMDVENSTNLDKATALWAAVSYVLADLSVDINSNSAQSLNIYPFWLFVIILLQRIWY